MQTQLVIQSHNFSNRLSWMLSSLFQQKLNDSVELSVHLSFLRGTETEKVADFFSRYLSIKKNAYTSFDTFQYRGLTRSFALQKSTADWILFTDSDMIYHPLFFYNLKGYIREHKLQDYTGMFIAGRMSNEIIDANLLIANNPHECVGDYFFSDAFEHARTLKLHRKSNVGAGYFQLINRTACNHEDYYVTANECKDFSWGTKYQKANSDKQFRRRIGLKHRLPLWFTENQIHLNHNRDNMTKTHILEKR